MNRFSGNSIKMDFDSKQSNRVAKGRSKVNFFQSFVISLFLVDPEKKGHGNKMAATKCHVFKNLVHVVDKNL